MPYIGDPATLEEFLEWIREWRQYIKPNIRNQKCEDALEVILKPAGLTYQTKEGVIVLDKRQTSHFYVR